LKALPVGCNLYQTIKTFSMDFVTVDSKLSVEGNIIKQKRLTNTFSRIFFLYAFFLLWFINAFIEKIALAQQTGKGTMWISVIISGIILLLYVGVLYDFLFRRYWKNQLDISNINKITVKPSDEGLETNVVVTLKSKRYKLYKFRILEKQYEDFIETVRSINPSIQVVTS
jgi:hypothetical protein